jgi:hypothetical protein
VVRPAVRVRTSILTAIAFLAFVASAQAQITVGQLAPTSAPTGNCSETFDEWQTSVASGASYAVPAPGGAITSWSTLAAGNSGQKFGFKLLRRTGAAYTVIGHDGPEALVPGSLNTFPIGIPAQAGDLISMYIPSPAETSPVACNFGTELAGDVIAYRFGNALDTETLEPENEYEGERLNISATVLPPPTISGLGDVTGSIEGGSAVVVSGANFAKVSGVNFGTTAATSFTVNSEGQITAIAPPSTTLSKVPISVMTIAGTASSPTTFAYEGCKVPGLSGKKLKAAKKKLVAADCKLGKVKKLNGATSKTGKVKRQSPKPGKLLAPGSKVNLKLA